MNLDKTEGGPIRIAQLIAPTAYYGAERWLVALNSHLDPTAVVCELITLGAEQKNVAELVHAWTLTGSTATSLVERGRFDPALVTRLVRLLKKKRIHIIHSHGYKSDIVGLIAARLAGVQLVITPHGFGVDLSRSVALYAQIGLRAARYADAVVPISIPLLNEYKSSGVSVERLHLIENAVDLDDVARNSGGVVWSFPFNKPKTLVYVGRLVAGKQVDHLLHVVKALSGKIPNLRLKIIGEGPKRSELQHLAESLKLTSIVQFAGFRDDRLRHVAEAAAYVLPSRSEGMPRSMMEAMSLGVPCVAYAIDGVTTLAEDRISALLASPFDIEELTRCCHEILTNKPLAESLGRAAQMRVVERFSGERLAREYLSMYRQLLTCR